jgi:branched-chain amino acid transport system permease protein
MRALLAERPRLRAAVIGTGVVLGLLVLTQVIFPGDPSPARGTPAAILFRGAVQGLVMSLFAVGVILIYRTMRFINFAQGAFGSVGVVVMTYTLVFTPLPFPIAFALGLAVSALLGLVAGIFLLRFLNRSRLFLTVVTIVGSGFIFGSVITFVTRLPFWPSPDRITNNDARALTDIKTQLPFQGWEFQVGSFPVKFGFAEVFAIELSVIALLAVVAFLRYTRAGAAVRAMAENPERASLLGISVGTLSVVVWVLATTLDGLAATAGRLAAPELGGEGLFASILIPFTAAVIARFRGIGTAVFASIVIGVFRMAFVFSFSDQATTFDGLLFVAVAAGLLLQRRGFERSDLGAAVSWAATDEPRPIPKEMRSIRSLSIARYGLAALGIMLVIVFPFIFSTQRIVLGGVIFIHAIAVLSLVVLTGWAGQVSLGQWGLVGVGSVVGGALTTTVGLPFWFAVPLAIVISAAVAVLIGIPALRIRGLFLLVTTFAFAIAVRSVLFDDRYFGWLLPDGAVDRPTLFFLDFEDETSMYFLTAFGLLLTILVVRNLRRSRLGRMLISVRESEANLQSFGVNIVRAKLTAFAVAGGIAGFAGILFAHHQRGIAAASFGADTSVNVFVESVIGGVTSAGGALLGSAYIQLTSEFAGTNAILATIFSGVVPLLILFMAPGGLISLVNGARDSVLRIIAQRRRLVVPSLFADYDPEVAERQLIPFTDPSSLSGLAVLGPTRYTMRSELYKGKGERIIDRIGPVKESRDTVAFKAAAALADDDERERALAAPVGAVAEGEGS